MSAGEFGDPRTVEITERNPEYKCCFCGRHEVNAVEWGSLLKLDDIVTHHFCLLFSAKIGQNGNDSDGIQAFLPNDIKQEIRRGNRLKCKFCKKSTATIGCSVQKCSFSYHYPCGYENGCLFQFYGQFQSFCPKHRPHQKIPAGSDVCCPICYMDTDQEDAIWPPCCGKQLFHRHCIMYTAKAAGYFFKCPLCNSNTDQFKTVMRANGVFVPEQDAAWETVPNAFHELMEHYSRCDANPCLCPDGPDHDKKDSKYWCLIRCNGCGSSATHMKCSKLTAHTWKCETCDNVLQNSGTGSSDSPDESSSDDSDSDDPNTDSDSSDSDEDSVIPKLADLANVVPVDEDLVIPKLPDLATDVCVEKDKVQIRELSENVIVPVPIVGKSNKFDEVEVLPLTSLAKQVSPKRRPRNQMKNNQNLREDKLVETTSMVRRRSTISQYTVSTWYNKKSVDKLPLSLMKERNDIDHRYPMRNRYIRTSNVQNPGVFEQKLEQLRHCSSQVRAIAQDEVWRSAGFTHLMQSRTQSRAVKKAEQEEKKLEKQRAKDARNSVYPYQNQQSGFYGISAEEARKLPKIEKISRTGGPDPSSSITSFLNRIGQTESEIDKDRAKELRKRECLSSTNNNARGKDRKKYRQSTLNIFYPQAQTFGANDVSHPTNEFLENVPHEKQPLIQPTLLQQRLLKMANGWNASDSGHLSVGSNYEGYRDNGSYAHGHHPYKRSTYDCCSKHYAPNDDNQVTKKKSESNGEIQCYDVPDSDTESDDSIVEVKSKNEHETDEISIVDIVPAKVKSLLSPTLPKSAALKAMVKLQTFSLPDSLLRQQKPVDKLIEPNSSFPPTLMVIDINDDDDKPMAGTDTRRWNQADVYYASNYSSFHQIPHDYWLNKNALNSIKQEYSGKLLNGDHCYSGSTPNLSLSSNSNVNVRSQLLSGQFYTGTSMRAENEMNSIPIPNPLELGKGIGDSKRLRLS